MESFLYSSNRNEVNLGKQKGLIRYQKENLIQRMYTHLYYLKYLIINELFIWQDVTKCRGQHQETLQKETHW